METAGGKEPESVPDNLADDLNKMAEVIFDDKNIDKEPPFDDKNKDKEPPFDDKNKDKEPPADDSFEDGDNSNDLLITHLPEVALVSVMEYLNLKERYYLSLTCKLFYNLFPHPQLWKRAHIDLLCVGESGTRDYSRWKLKYVMNSTMVEIVKRFSHLFQHLSLHLNGNVQVFDESSATLLDELRHQCRLESLTLKLGPLTSSNDYVRSVMSIRSNPKDVPLVVGLIHSAYRLKRLKIISWPLFVDMEDSNILQAIQSNEKLRMLESLSLFFIDVKKESWSERIPKLPTVQQTSNVISFLTNLTHLALRSPMINDETVLLLASNKRKCLTLFQILVVFARPSIYNDGFPIPQIATSSWQKLKVASPDLKVELLVLTRIPTEELRVMLKPGIPLSSFSLLNYSQCDSFLLDHIASHFQSCLQTLICLCDSSYCNQALIKLVKECRGLKYLAFHGDINYKTVMELAELTKDEKDRWELFQFKERNIKTESADEEDDDLVVKFDATNQRYYVGGIQSWHVDEEKHRRKMDQMIDCVRKYLGASQNCIV